jgi:hypothetical protein
LWNANQLQSRSVSSAAPANGQVLKWDGANWSPGTDNGQAYTAGTGINIAGNSISAQNTADIWNANQLRDFPIATDDPLVGQYLQYIPPAIGGPPAWRPAPAPPQYWSQNGTNVYYLNNVGIGTSTPTSTLHVAGGGFTIVDETITKFGSNSLEFTSHIIPLVDNNRSLGLASRRFTVVWAVNGTIQTSDARDKQNIQSLTYGIDAIMKLKPVSYEWKDPNDGKVKLGLLAQDLELVIPEVIARATDEDDSDSDRLGVYYSDLIPVLIKAMQEQEAKIRLMQHEIELLKHN